MFSDKHLFGSARHRDSRRPTHRHWPSGTCDAAFGPGLLRRGVRRRKINALSFEKWKNLSMSKIKRALISVYDKTGVVAFAKALHGFGVEIISTGGTAE